MKMDIIYENGCFYTMEKEGETIEAIAVYDGKIVALGTMEEAKTWEADKRVDLKGSPVIPGMADTHMHLYLDCISRNTVDLSNCRSYQEVIDVCRPYTKDLKEGEWFQAENLHMDRLKEKKFPSKEVLDQITTDNPVCIGSFCHHVHMLNTKAMEICNIHEKEQEAVPKSLDVDEENKPNGVVREQSYNVLVEKHIPTVSMEKVMKMMKEYFHYCSSVGITQLHIYQEDHPAGIRLYQEMEKKGDLNCRLTFNFTEDQNDKGIITTFGNDKLKMGAVKFLLDGSVGAATCLMNADFSDKPGARGQASYTQEELNAAVKRAYDAGNDVAVHAIGDKANDMLLTAIENAWDPELKDDRRFYIIHATIISDTFVERARKLPVIISVQPIFMENFVGMSAARLGKEREDKLFALRTMMDGGLLLTGSSDAPVREINPFHGIYCSVARKARCSDEYFAPSQAISVYEALEMYTKNAAYHCHEEAIKGTLREGKVADFVVLDRDLFKVSVDDIPDTKVLMTVLGGDIVYSEEK